ncbi:MAG: TetR/AcrR family transcriptional regulator [Acidimicrobiia bacterium]
MTERNERAGPLAADDRRQAIVEAVIPLLLEKGSAVTTREMAEAAGIAEGTIFRVFPDKASVVHAAVEASMDPEQISQAIAAIPATDPLDVQLETAARILVERSERVGALVGVLRSSGSHGSGPPAGARQYVTDANTAILGALVELFEHNSDEIRVTPRQAAIAFRGFVFATAHPLISPDEKPVMSESVDVLMNGISTAGEDPAD